MRNWINKPKSIIVISESKNNNCTEKKYFDILQKNFRDNLKFDLISYTTSKNFSESKFISLIPKISGTIKNFIIVCDNDCSNQLEFNFCNYKNDMDNFIKNNIKLFKNIKPNYEINLYGIPKNKINFDYFILMRYDKEIFINNKKDPYFFLKKDLVENYKGNEKYLEKIFKNKDWLNNLINNSKYDENYNKLVLLLYK